MWFGGGQGGKCSSGQAGTVIMLLGQCGDDGQGGNYGAGQVGMYDAGPVCRCASGRVGKCGRGRW